MTDPDTSRLGIDWGTSNRRAYLLDAQGGLMRQHSDEAGILHVNGDFEGSLRQLLQTLGLQRADIVMSGMVGSRNGWHEVPYLSMEQPLTALHDNLMEVRTSLPEVRCRIAPGYKYIDANGIPDVMRGEETQVLGALSLSAANGWFLLPGTHSKWVRVENGGMIEFLTFMTGELFSLMSQHGTLSKVMTEQQSVPEAFAAGVQAARHGSFTHTAFCCRALVVTDMMPPDHTASYLSGLLIGTEVYDILKRTDAPQQSAVQVVGSPALSARYLSALELLGIEARAWQPDAVYLAALRALFSP
ncbi:2-dehydro-3-deoxygalactonokinase [Noviherbaspirillum saxi]|uniref:2-dehydro-3-deoxygalactonokinase n=1 Tax=Noviherbaspirillum saxi TaxID=2320863 RepID=A0A3A3G6K0_9BURK|nr:2-dehydro-3-deoxygalactonokinase [Noviherbaspirillum saxi]RJF95810.1 2-dehydro-3-deoxygalactonokinase [Noviherbaspirillum saxi]